MRGRKLKKAGIEGIKVQLEEIDNPRMRGRKRLLTKPLKDLIQKKLIIPG